MRFTPRSAVALGPARPGKTWVKLGESGRGGKSWGLEKPGKPSFGSRSQLTPGWLEGSFFKKFQTAQGS